MRLFLGLPALAGVLQLILIAAGQPWTWRDLPSSVVFAIAVAAATVLLARRQMDLQEATAILQQSLAQTKLVEKIGSITGALDDVATTGQASTAHHILIDARAGLNLLPYADEHARTEVHPDAGVCRLPVVQAGPRLDASLHPMGRRRLAADQPPCRPARGHARGADPRPSRTAARQRSPT